ncbi:hypothetical protein CC99x_000970 [Candidatus Berkiella cookevillensis]|uniref:Uncharacterized protein n=1 Tax=Candidatus Berkiella cookevillensis TaxID=437022 RepID=A0A0Q9YFY7_9GAMM|nr:hypothetical protein [Candidatus Berkiella cookevillensis]MCS5707467.1 hypothetical protein [Candidatus Berkiella cookevillensis]
MHLEPVPPSHANIFPLYLQNDGPQGGPPPPPPPPPGKIPPPPPGNIPPPPGGKGPLGKLGAKAIADKALAEMNEAERKTWVNQLKFNDIYPDDARTLVDLGFSNTITMQSKTIANAQHKQPSQAYYQAEVLKLLNQAYGYPPKRLDPYKAEIEKELKGYKDSRGLINAYHSLYKWNCLLKLDSEKNPNYLQTKENAKQLQNEYATLLTEFQDIKEQTKLLTGDEQASAFEQLAMLRAQMQEKVDQLKSIQKKIVVSKAGLDSNQASFNQSYGVLKAAEQNAQKEIDRINAEIAQKSKNAGNAILDPNGMIQEEVDALGIELLAAQEKLQEAIAATAEQKSNIDAAEQKYKDSYQKVKEKLAIRSLLEEPSSWKSIQNMKIGAKMDEQKVSANEDPEFIRCMEIDGKNRSFNIRFLSATQQARLAYFFAAEAKDVQELLPTNREQQRALMTAIDGKLSFVEELNFTMLMDIAEGRIKRQKGTWAGFSANELLKNITTNDSVHPNYAALEAQYNLYTLHKDFKDDELKNAFIEANKERGITFIAEPIVKGKKPYDFKRKIDISYLTESQTDRLARFLSKSENEFIKEGGVDIEALSTHLNTVLNDTNLSFEKFCDIIEGHLERTPGNFAPQDNYACLETAVRTVGNPPHYESIVQQRKADIQRKIEEEATRRQQEQEARAEAKRLADEEKQQKKQALIEQAQETARTIIEGFGEIIPNADFSNPKIVNTFELYLKAEIAQIEDATLKEMVDEHLQEHLLTLRPDPTVLDLPNPDDNDNTPVVMQPPMRSPVLFSPPPQQVDVQPEHPPQKAKDEVVEPKVSTTNALGLSIRKLNESREAAKPTQWQADVETNVESRKLKGQYYAATLLLNPVSIDMNNMLQNATTDFRSWTRKWQSITNKVQSSTKLSSTLPELNAIQSLIIELNLSIPEDATKVNKFLQQATSNASFRNPINPIETILLEEITQSQGIADFLHANQQHPDRMGLNKLAIIKGMILERLEYYKYERHYMKDNFGATCEHILNEIDKQAGDAYDVLKNDPRNDAFCKHLYEKYKADRDYFLTHTYQSSASKPRS